MKRIISFLILTFLFWFLLVLSGCENVTVYHTRPIYRNARPVPHRPIIVLPHRPYHPYYRRPRQYRIMPYRYPSNGFHNEHGARVRNDILFLPPPNNIRKKK